MVERERLDRDQRLVVIHRERDVVGGARDRMEHGVGRDRPAGVDAVGDQAVDGRFDDIGVFATQRAVLAGVRVEPGDGEARPGDAEAILEVARGDPPRGDDQIAIQFGRHLGERQMDGHRHDGKLG